MHGFEERLPRVGVMLDSSFVLYGLSVCLCAKNSNYWLDFFCRCDNKLCSAFMVMDIYKADRKIWSFKHWQQKTMQGKLQRQLMARRLAIHLRITVVKGEGEVIR